MSKIEPRPVDKSKLKTRSRKKYPWYEMLTLLLQGESFFVEVDRRSAHYIKRKLNSVLAPFGIVVDATPATETTEEGDVEGYIISVSDVRGEIMLVDKRFIKEQLLKELNKKIKRAEGELGMLEKLPKDRKLTKTIIQLKTRIETLKEVIELINRL